MNRSNLFYIYRAPYVQYIPISLLGWNGRTVDHSRLQYFHGGKPGSGQFGKGGPGLEQVIMRSGG